MKAQYFELGKKEEKIIFFLIMVSPIAHFGLSCIMIQTSETSRYNEHINSLMVGILNIYQYHSKNSLRKI